jgi:endonuclease YncB( thermonuclease family)
MTPPTPHRPISAETPTRRTSRRLVLPLTAAACGAVALAVWVGLPAEVGSHHTSHLSAPTDKLAVLDAGTLRVGRQIVRLDGVTAPATGTICHGDRRVEFDCATAATVALTSMVQDTSVECTIQGHDSQGLPIGDCEAAGQPLNRRMVRDGWAHASIASLQEPEAEARSAHRGIWRPMES